VVRAWPAPQFAEKFYFTLWGGNTLKLKHLKLAASILISISVALTAVPTSAADNTAASASSADAASVSEESEVSSVSEGSLDTAAAESGGAADASASSLSESSDESKSADGQESSEDKTDNAAEIGDDIRDIISQTADLSDGNADLTSADALKDQIHDTIEEFDALSEEEQQVLSESRKALTNAEASVDSVSDALTEMAETGTVTVAQDEKYNSWRYINGQPVEDAIDTVEDETAAVQALHEGEPDTVVQALKSGEASVVTGETEAYRSDNVSDGEADGILLSDKGSFGVDVSTFQGSIDWAKAKADGVTFAILRVGYGSDISSQDDDTWETNADACEKLGIPYGAYLYSYADTTQKVSSEISHTLRLLEGHRLSLPVFYDMEDGVQSVLPASTLCDFANQYCASIIAAGYKAGIYSSKNWWEGKLSGIAQDITYYHWVAQWNSVCDTNAAYQLWQNSSSGSVDGISGSVDTDYCYFDPNSQSSIIVANPGSMDEATGTRLLYSTFGSQNEWLSGQNGSAAGTTYENGSNDVLQFLTINETMASNLSVKYRVSSTNIGWDTVWHSENTSKNWLGTLGNVAGTAGYQLEAVQIELTGSEASKYSIYYCTNVYGLGWLDWTKDGATAGTTGQGLGILGIRIVILPKGSAAPENLGDAGYSAKESSAAPAASDAVFTDVQDSSSYYYTPVYWAQNKGVASGFSSDTFGPSVLCTRAQIITFLYRLFGNGEVSSQACPFTDVSETSYYCNAVNWAYSHHITTGTSASAFSPNKTCTRGQIVTFLYNYLGNGQTYQTSPFQDVSKDSYYYNAVNWAVSKGVTSGTSSTAFSPEDTCTRAEAVTFLYRAVNS
jgi:GH25 family lysozyme M1 (1,4-beta-N-acetylmuramidase)